MALLALAQGGDIQTVLDDLRIRWGNMLSVIENNTLQEFWEVQHDSGAQWSHCALAPLIMFYHGILGLCPIKAGFEKCTIMPQMGNLEELHMQAHTVRGSITFKMVRKKKVWAIALSIPKGMECELILDSRENVNLEIGSEKTGQNQTSYILPTGEKTKLVLEYL